MKEMFLYLYNLLPSWVGKQFGEKGFDYITDTNPHTGNYMCIEAVTDTVVSAITYESSHTIGGTSIVADSDILKAGNTLYVPFTSITLTSGKIKAHKK